MTADSIARALKARRSGTGWMAKCPAHDDHSPSLSIRDFDGKVLLHCHAGCAQTDVIEACMWGDYHARELALYLQRMVDNKPYLKFWSEPNA